MGDLQWPDGRPVLTKFMRPPTLAISAMGTRAILENGFEYIINGSTSTADYGASSLEQEIKVIRDGLYYRDKLRKGAIFVMHMTSAAKFTATALDVILTANEKKADNDPTKFKVGLLSDYLDYGYSQGKTKKQMNQEKRRKKTKNEYEKEEPVHDILMHQSPDRRLLPHMPGKHRSGKSRRAISDEEVKKYPYLKFFNGEDANVRYDVRYPVKISVSNKAGSYSGYASDISITGMKLHVSKDAAEAIAQKKVVTLSFEIEPGTVPEGLEMKVKTAAHAAWPNEEVVQQKLADVRSGKLSSDTEFIFGMQFEHNLLEYSNRHHARSELMMASFLLFVICLGVVLMRTESVIYFKFNKYLYLYSIIASTFLLTKYAFGFFYKPVPADESYTPGVTIIVPCFNEETWIRQTILNAMDQYYPQDKLEVIVVDDCSTDNSAKVIRETIQDIIDQEGSEVASRISYILQPVNKGKREALALGAKHAQHELLVFVDSDSFLNPYAIINLVQPFKDEQVGGVSGRTDVANTYTNSLTKMQSVRYYIAFRVMKAAEGLFDAVSCLSGPLSCYRKDLVLKYSDDWLNQKFLGQRATFGDDRAMTNMILRHNRTDYQDTAICYTIVPNDYDVFLKQQMRWKRSWLRESLIAGSFMWKKEPFAAISFYMGLLVPIIAPVIVCYNLLYIIFPSPIAYSPQHL